MAGTVILYHADPTIYAMAPETGIMVAFFQSMSAMTTVGFNTVPITGLAAAPLFLVMMLMIVGASPSGTGRGPQVDHVHGAVGTAQEHPARR